MNNSGKVATGCGQAMMGCGCLLMMVPIIIFCVVALLAIATGGVPK